MFIRGQRLLRDRGGELRATQLPVVQGRGEAPRYSTILSFSYMVNSVADPDSNPDPSDPYVFGPHEG